MLAALLIAIAVADDSDTPGGDQIYFQRVRHLIVFDCSGAATARVLAIPTDEEVVIFRAAKTIATAPLESIE